MSFVWRHSGPLGIVLLSSADGSTLSGLWFADQRYYARGLEKDTSTEYLAVFAETEAWLHRYYRGMDPGPPPQTAPLGTQFQLRVWNAMREIPYGETRTYGELVASVTISAEGKRVSPRAVGGAVSRNPISILLPCHRVLAADGSLHGYAGGLWRKAALLAMEQGIPFSD